MRFLDVGVVAVSSLIPITLVAQHTPPSIPSPPVANHVPSATPVALRVPVISASPMAGTHLPSAPQAVHSGTTTRIKQPTIANVKPASTSVSSPNSKHRGFWRKREPVQSKNTCKGARCSERVNTTTQLQPTAPSPAPSGCRVVPVANPGIPCTSLAPCCP